MPAEPITTIGTPVGELDLRIEPWPGEGQFPKRGRKRIFVGGEV